jgi:hypothetical protein
MGDRQEVLAAISSLHTVNLNALLVLVQTLEEAGLVTAEHYAGNLRMHADLWAPHIGTSVADLLRNYAERLEAREEASSN